MRLDYLQMEDFEKWCSQLEIRMDDLRKKAGVVATRKAKSDIKKGEGRVIHRKLMAAALDMERRRSTPTPFGSLVLLYDDLCRTGAELGKLDPAALARLVSQARTMLANRRAENALTEIEDSEG